MNLENELSERFRAEAHGLTIDTPSPRNIHRLVDRRRRRRIAARGASGVAVLACTVAGIGVITTRGSDQPAPNANQPTDTTAAPPPPVSSAPITTPVASSTPPTLDVTSSSALSVTPSPDQWSALPTNGLSPRFQQLTVATDNGIFEWGGYNTQSLADGAYYDDDQQTWRALPPAPLSTDRGDAVGVWTGTEVVVVNGTDGNVKAAAFNPTAFTWRTLEDPDVDNAANAAAQIAYVNDSVLLFTIIEDGAGPQDQATLLDLTTGTWSATPTPPAQLRSSVDIVLAGDEAFIIGQSDQGANECGLLHVLAYSPAANSWRELPATPIASYSDMVTVWTGTELFFGGGAICEDGVANGEPRTDAHLLDPVTGQWRTAADAPVGFYGAGRYRDNWTGQSVAALTQVNSIVLYNPATDSWHTSPTIQQTRIINGATLSTPVVTFRGDIIITDGGLTGVGEEDCCDQITTTFRYTPPDGY